MPSQGRKTNVINVTRAFKQSLFKKKKCLKFKRGNIRRAIAIRHALPVFWDFRAPMLERDSSRSINICSAGTHKIERTEEPIDYTSMKIASPFSMGGFRVIFISNDLHLARVTMRNDRATFGCIITEDARTSCSRLVGIPFQHFRLHSILFLFPVCHESTIFFSTPYIWLMYTYVSMITSNRCVSKKSAVILLEISKLYTKLWTKLIEREKEKYENIEERNDRIFDCEYYFDPICKDNSA